MGKWNWRQWLETMRAYTANQEPREVPREPMPTKIVTVSAPPEMIRAGERVMAELYGNICPKCGCSSCEHNEDPVDNCPKQGPR